MDKVSNLNLMYVELTFIVGSSYHNLIASTAATL